MPGLHVYVEPIVFFTCACSYGYRIIESQFVYQYVSQSFKFTKDETVYYCSESSNRTVSVSEQAQVVANEVARWTKIANLLRAAANAVSVLVITSWSGAIGRRNALFFPVVGAFVSSTLLLINIYFRKSLVLYVISSFIFGATGGWTTLVNVATAHLSDIIGKEKRRYRYTILETCSAVGGGLSQIGTGFWLHHYGFLPPTIFVIGCSVVALLLTIFLKTNNPRGNSTSNEFTKIVSIDSNEETNKRGSHEDGLRSVVSELREVYRIYTSNSVECNACDQEGVKCVHCDIGSKNRVWRLWVYLLTYAIYMAAVDGFLLFNTMFLVSFPLCFTPDLVGLQAGLDSSSMILSPIVLLLLRSSLQFSILGTLLMSILGRISTCIFMFFATGPLFVFIGTSMGVLGHLTTPFIRVAVSNLVSPSEQGPVFALIPSISKMVNVFTPLMILSIYTATLHIRYSFIWAVMALFFVVAFILMSVVWVADESPCWRAKRDGTPDGKR